MHRMALEVQIQKVDAALQLVYGEVYVPGVPDSQGDFMTSQEIVKMAHRFMANRRVHQIDREHDNVKVDAYVAESFVAREGDPDFIPGAWVVGIHIVDTSVWGDVVEGRINGFSMEAMATRVERIIEVDLPTEVEGDTDIAEGHRHRFYVRFSDEGEFLGGETDFVHGHKHEIVRGTRTEVVESHSHRYSFAEAFNE